MTLRVYGHVLPGHDADAADRHGERMEAYLRELEEGGATGTS